MTEKLISIVSDSAITEKMKEFGLVDPRSAVLIPMLEKIGKAETAGRGAIKNIVAYVSLGSLGIYREGREYVKGERLSTEVIQDAINAINNAALLTTLKRGAWYAMHECGIETKEETINRRKVRKIASVSPIDSKKIEEMQKFFRDSHQTLDKYFPESAKQMKAEQKTERINKGAFAKIESTLENQVRKANEWIKEHGNSEKTDENEMKYQQGMRDILNDCLALIRRKNTQGAYDKYR